MKALKILYTNTDQFLNKRDLLVMSIADDEPDVIILNEVIPKAQTLPIPNALLSVSGFSLYTNFDPSRTNLGSSGIRGICILVSERLHSSECKFQGSSFQEHLWVRVKLLGSDYLIIGCIYRSPSSDPHRSVEQLGLLLQEVCSSNPSHLLITGDFNIPHIDWNLKLSQEPATHFSHTFLEKVGDCYLTQHIKEPTRYREGQASSLLDLVLTNEEGMVSDLRHLAPLGSSDHVVIRFGYKCYTSKKELSTPKRSFGKGDYDRLRALLADADWPLMHDMNVHDAYSFLKEVVERATDVCVPKTKPGSKKKNIYMNKQALKLRRKKD